MQHKVIKKNNHYVPKAYLRGWETLSLKLHGKKIVRFFDLRTGNIINSDQKRLFASEEDLYILEKNGSRNYEFEDYFQVAENSLGLFLNRLRDKKSLQFNDDQWSLVIESLIGLSYRSPRLIRLMTKAFRIALEGTPPDEYDLKRNVLRLIFDSIDGKTERFSGFRPIVVEMHSEDLITCEVPFWNMEGSKFKKLMGIVPLTSNKLLLIGEVFPFLSDLQPANENSPIVVTPPIDVSTKIIEMVNNFTIERARKWIIFSNNISEKEYLRISTDLTKEHVRARWELDNFSLHIFGQTVEIPLRELETFEDIF